MVQYVVPNQNLPIVLYQEILGVPQLGNILPIETVSYHILLNLLQVGGELEWYLGKS